MPECFVYLFYQVLINLLRFIFNNFFIHTMRINIYYFCLIFIYLLINACSPKKAKVLSETTQVQVDSVFVEKDTVEVVTIDSTLIEDTVAIIPPEPVIPSVMAKLQRKACFGKCPVFELRIYEDGLVIYNGKNHVPRVGWHEAQLDSSAVQYLQKRANDIGFFEMKPTYPPYGQVISDVPTTITYIKKAEQEKTIINHHSSPVRLQRFERYIDTLMDTLSWKWVEKPSRE